jgi:hypothetical protein
MKKIFSKIAAVLAFIIGAMAVFAGAKVLLGNQVDYYVINWLPLYNYSIGLVTILITAVLIWRNSRFALSATIATLALHTTVMVIIQTAFRDVVAPDSIQAMTIRMIVWVVILILLVLQIRKNKTFLPEI